jgi:hypothetical protein
MEPRRVPPLWADLVETLALVPVALILVLMIRSLWMGAHSPSDFRSFYDSARALTGGLDPYLESASVPMTPNLNPPVFVTIFAFIAVFQPGHGAVVWLLLNVLALIISLRIIWRQLPALPEGRRLALLMSGFAGTQAQLLLGQTAWLMMLPGTLSWRAFRLGRQVRGGLWLGLLIGLKPLFLPVLCILVLRRQGRALLAAAGVVAATVLAGAWGCGWAAYASWFGQGASVYWFALPLNASLLGVLSRVTSENWARPLWLAGSAGVSACAVWRVARSPLNADRDLALAFLTVLLVSPLGWVYYLPVALGPLLAVSRITDWRWWRLLGVALLFWPVTLGRPLLADQLARTPWNAVVGSLYAVGLLTLWWMTVRVPPATAAEP